LFWNARGSIATVDVDALVPDEDHIPDYRSLRHQVQPKTHDFNGNSRKAVSSLWTNNAPWRNLTKDIIEKKWLFNKAPM